MTGRVVAVGHVGIAARDLESLARFYRETLGLKQSVYHANVVAIFEVGTTDVFLVPGASSDVGFDLAADDIDALRDRLVTAGVACPAPTVDKVSGHRSFTFSDPEGHRIVVVSAHPRS